MKRWSTLTFLVLLALLGSSVSACGRGEQQTAAGPVATVLPNQANVALGYALQFVDDRYAAAGVGAPPMELQWQRDYAETPEVSGAVALRFQSDTCQATVTYPALGTAEPIYHVVIDDEVSHFHWCGAVDATGNVQEFAGPGRSDAVDLPASALFARTAVLDQIRRGHPSLALPDTPAWTVAVEGESYLFAAGGWQLQLTRAAADPGGALFYVSMNQAQSGFQWNGTVDSFCRVRDTSLPGAGGHS